MTSVNNAAPVPIEHLQLGHYSGSVTGFLENQGYVVGRTVGEGSYCKVRAVDPVNQPAGHHGRMAVKIINRKRASQDFVTRFLPRELDIIRKLHHPHIIQIHRIIDIGEVVYIIMDLAERGDLLEYVRSHGALPEYKARTFFQQLVMSVRYLHSLDVAHRDLKCENVLIYDENYVKLGDFGFARYCIDKETGKRILSKTYCGSAAYAAPEILRGIPYNPKMYDVWSLGCILFIMVTGSMPFDDSNVKRMLRCQQEKRFSLPTRVAARLSEAVLSLIGSMLEPDVTKRITMDQIARHRWLQNGDGGSSPTTRSTTGSTTKPLVSTPSPTPS